jgi:hypothetical protein
VTDRAEPGTRLVEELRLLLDAVAERAGPWLDRVAASESSCGSCPVCAVVALVRGEPNELAARGLEHAADLVALLRAVLADRWEPGVPHMPGFTPSGEPHGERPKVQRIPVRRPGAGAPGAGATERTPSGLTSARRRASGEHVRREDGGLAEERERPMNTGATERTSRTDRHFASDGLEGGPDSEPARRDLSSPTGPTSARRRAEERERPSGTGSTP